MNVLIGFGIYTVIAIMTVCVLCTYFNVYPKIKDGIKRENIQLLSGDSVENAALFFFSVVWPIAFAVAIVYFPIKFFL
jgi:hypothetical protein